MPRGSDLGERLGELPDHLTSVSDALDGSYAVTNRGKWGGLIVLGRAFNNVRSTDLKDGGPAASTSITGTDGVGLIEGLSAGDTRHYYGMAVGSEIPRDNSGILRYVSLRHGGELLGTANEINGLTLGSVGSGTQIDHIEVTSNLDDGFEFFGGTVSAHHLVAMRCDATRPSAGPTRRPRRPATTASSSRARCATATRSAGRAAPTSVSTAGPWRARRWCTLDASACESDSTVAINELESTDDKIELYNAGAAMVDISGWILTDAVVDAAYDPEADLEKLVFADTVLAPKEFLIIAKGMLEGQHMFGLGGSDTVTLLKADLSIVDQVTYAEGAAAVSYCRLPDGPSGAWMADCSPTFGAANKAP